MPQFCQNHIRDRFEEISQKASLEEESTDVAVDMTGVPLAVEVVMEDDPREIKHIQDRFDSWLDAV